MEDQTFRSSEQAARQQKAGYVSQPHHRGMAPALDYQDAVTPIEAFFQSDQGGISGIRLLMLLSVVMPQPQKRLGLLHVKTIETFMWLDEVQSELLAVMRENQVPFESSYMPSCLETMTRLGLIEMRNVASRTGVAMTAYGRKALKRFAQ